MKNLQSNLNAWRIAVLKSNFLKGWKKRIMKDLLRERDMHHQNLQMVLNEKDYEFSVC